MHKRIKSSKLVLQDHTHTIRDQHKCGNHPDVYDWIVGARTQNPDGEIVVSGNGNFVGIKLREFAKDDRSQANFKQAFKATRLDITDDGKNVRLEMTVPSVRAKVLPRGYRVAA
jgi:hypothetical protein